MTNRAELEEIAHSGGKVTFTVARSEDGRLSYQVGWSHSRPNPTAIFAVYAIPQGVAVGDIDMRGMGVPWNPPPLPNCYPVLIASDGTGMFGHECPGCGGYWRAARRSVTCPYCASQAGEKFHFLTRAQLRYVKQYCHVLNDALDAGAPGTYEIDMDEVADAAGKEEPKPAFYYAEESQQNLFTCSSCGARADVLGTYAYCPSCGARNDLQELEANIRSLRDRINAGGPYESYVRDAVSLFDSYATQCADQLRMRVPLTSARMNRLERARFHNLDVATELFRSIFDIDLVAGLSNDDLRFATLMFHRRHVYEHKGGEADEKYITESGDNVRLKQALRETQESAHRTATVVLRLAKNLHDGFHDIFPPLEEPIREYNRRIRVAEGDVSAASAGLASRQR
jgi:hypothetical protein